MCLQKAMVKEELAKSIIKIITIRHWFKESMSASKSHSEDIVDTLPADMCPHSSESTGTLKQSLSDHDTSPMDVKDIINNEHTARGTGKTKLLYMPTDTEISHKHKSTTAPGDKPSDAHFLDVPIFEFNDEDKDLPEFELSKVKITTKIDQFDRNEKLTGLKSTYDFNAYTIDVSSKRNKPKDLHSAESTRKQKIKISYEPSAKPKLPTYKKGDYIPRSAREQMKNLEKSDAPVENNVEAAAVPTDNSLNIGGIITTANVITEPATINIESSDLSKATTFAESAEQFHSHQLSKQPSTMTFTTEQQSSSPTLNCESSNKSFNIVMNDNLSSNMCWFSNSANTYSNGFSDKPTCISDVTPPGQVEPQPGDTGIVLGNYAVDTTQNGN